jgi:hypothetical protein
MSPERLEPAKSGHSTTQTSGGEAVIDFAVLH